MSILNRIALLKDEHPRVNVFLWALLAGSFVSSLFDAMISPFLAILFTQRFGLGPGTTGLIIGTITLVAMLLAIPSGALADRFGSVPIALLGFAFNGMGLLGLASAKSLTSFALFAGFLAAGRALYMPATIALLTLIAGQKQEMRVRGFRYMATNLGFSCGPVIGAFLGLADSGKGFIAAAIFNFVTLGALAFSAWLCFQQGTRTDIFAYSGVQKLEKSPKFSLLEGLKPTFMKFHVLAAFVTSLAYAQHQSTLSQSLFAREGASGITIYALLMTINGVTAVALQLPLNALSTRIGIRSGILLGHTCYALGFLGFALPASSWVFPCLSMVLFTIGEVLCVLNVSAVPISASGSANRGRYLGAAQLAQAGGGLGPMLGGLLLATLGNQWTWIAVALIVGFATWLHDLSLRALARNQSDTSRSPRCQTTAVTLTEVECEGLAVSLPK